MPVGKVREITNIAQDREKERKNLAIDFLKKIETNKDAMSIFIH